MRKRLNMLAEFAAVQPDYRFKQSQLADLIKLWNSKEKVYVIKGLKAWCDREAHDPRP